MNNKPHGLTGRPSNNQKPESEKLSSRINFSVTQATKAAWVKKAQARGMKLSQWIIENCDQGGE